MKIINQTKFYFEDIDKVNGPQMCYINSGFLNTDKIIAVLSRSRVNYVFGFIDSFFYTIFWYY